VLYLAYNRLDLIGRGGLFHDDHHLDPDSFFLRVAIPYIGQRACARNKRPSASW
jgi:hypothetical protein